MNKTGQGGNIMRKYIYVILGSLIAFLIAHYLFNCDVLSIISGSMPLLAFEIYKFCNDVKLKAEDRYRKRIKERFTKFRKKLTKLQKLARKLNNLCTPGVITLLANEVANGLLFNLQNGITTDPTLELLNPNNKHYIETIIGTVREKNDYVKKLTKYENQIQDAIADISDLFPAFGILLFTLFSLLIIFNDKRTSTKRIYGILNDETLLPELMAITQGNSTIMLETRLTYFLKRYITRLPVRDDKFLTIIITEKLLPPVSDLVEQLLWAHSLLDDSTLQILSDKQRKSIKIDNPPYEFTSVCNNYLKQILEDFDSETRKYIDELYKEVNSLVIESQKLNYPINY